MVDSDNGEETVHCFTLYFSLSNILSFKNVCYLELGSDPPRGQLNPHDYQHLLQNAIKLFLPRRLLILLPAKAKYDICHKPFNFVLENHAK